MHARPKLLSNIHRSHLVFQLSRRRNALAVPIPYEGGIKPNVLNLNPHFITDLADLSTMVEWLLEKAAPPCAVPSPYLLVIMASNQTEGQSPPPYSSALSSEYKCHRLSVLEDDFYE